jgi:RecA-family ATPase
MNFWINSNKNIWHCFRCGSGGGVLSAIAVQEGLINCSDAKSGAIRGHLARECILIARHKYGFTGDFKSYSTMDDEQKQKKEEKKKEDYQLIWDNELKNFKIEEKEWLVDKLIPSKAVCIITGKRGTMKTFMTLLLCYSVASGEEFLDKFKTSQGKVIYLDKENGINIMKNRTMMLKRGLERENDEFPIGFICFSQIKIDKLGGVAAIEEVIEQHKPKLLVIDTYRRSVGFDENDAGKVSELFVDILRPIVEKYNISVILIHHNRKSATNHGEVSDEMDELRGSSDLANYADLIIKLERHGNKIIVKQLKNRNAEEIQPFSVMCNFCEEDGEATCVRMKYDGEYAKPTKGDRCAESIILWMETNQRYSLKTSDLKDLCFEKGFKKNQLHNALNELCEKGILKQIGRGEYENIS